MQATGQDADKNKLGVLPVCWKDGYNECVVTKELAAHNSARLAREDTPALTHDAKASAKIQEMLNDDTKKYADADLSDFKDLQTIAGGDFKDCL